MEVVNNSLVNNNESDNIIDYNIINVISPIEKHGGISVKRNDLLQIGEINGLKVMGCLYLLEQSIRNNTKGFITVGSRTSPQCNILSFLCEQLKIPCHLFMPDSSKNSEIQAKIVKRKYSTIHRVKTGRGNVLRHHSIEFSKLHPELELIPYGLESNEVMHLLSRQTENIPQNIKHITIPIGGANNISALLWGLYETGRTDISVTGVITGDDTGSVKYLKSHLPPKHGPIEIVKYRPDLNPSKRYTTEHPAAIGNVPLHPTYEGKCYDFIKWEYGEDELFWIVGGIQKNYKGMEVTCKTTDTLPLSALTEFQGNLKQRTEQDYEKILKSIEEHGFAVPFFVWSHDGINHVLDGHGRLGALQRLVAHGEQLPDLPVVYVNCKDEADAKKLLLKINSHYGEMTAESVLGFLDGLEIDFEDLSLPTGNIDLSLRETEQTTEKKEFSKLTDKFLINPFSVLDSRLGPWKERKQLWKSLGMRSEEGRDDKMLEAMARWSKNHTDQGYLPDESIFDPVLCELMYTWFAKEGANILDPFAGGSVRGVVAGVKKCNYTGFDIRPEQIESNEKQAHIATDLGGILPKWVCSDSAKMNDVLPADYEADLVFSCPPYADLETYSDLEGDISNMKYQDFLPAYKDIVKKACSHLKNNRFAVFVVGEVCDKKTGNYYNFVADTISAFQEAGLHYYNEIVFLTQIAAKAWSAAEGMRKSRKVGKVHQNVLVFVKGDAFEATKYLGDIQILDTQDWGNPEETSQVSVE